MNDMNDIKHHLNDELLLGYSAGALPEAFNLIVATHLEMCDKCRAAAQAFDSVGGVLLDETAKVSMSKDALPKTLALISKVPKRKDSEQKTEIPNPISRICRQQFR